MKREEEFVLSHGQFALDMSVLSTVREDGGFAYCQVSAVWFRREKRVLRACAGTLHASFGPRLGAEKIPGDAREFALLADRRNHHTSADCMARWDGKTFWAAPPMHPDLQRDYLELLEPMLAEFPVAPGDYDAWWRFTDVF